MELNIEQIRNDEHRNQDETAAIRADITQRETNITSLVVEVLKVARELITDLKIQNALMIEKNKH
jgi:hypothetical protein